MLLTVVFSDAFLKSFVLDATLSTASWNVIEGGCAFNSFPIWAK